MKKHIYIVLILLIFNSCNNNNSFSENDFSNCIIKTIESQNSPIKIENKLKLNEDNYYIIKNDFSKYLENKKIYNKDIVLTDSVIKPENHIVYIHDVNNKNDTCTVIVSYFYNYHKFYLHSKFIKQNDTIIKILQRVGIE